MFNLGNLTVGVGADLTGLDRSLSTAGNMFTKFAKGVGLGMALNIGSGMADMAIGSPKDFLLDAVRLAAQYETAATQFSVMLDQSDVKAARMMTNLRAFAAESPLTLTTAVDESKKLLSAGIGEDQIIPSLRMLSDLAVGSTKKLTLLNLAYTQVMTAGKLYGTELRQVTETGVPAIKALATYLSKENLARGLEKVKEEDIRPMMERSAISARDFAGAMNDMTVEGGKFFDMTRRGAMTVEGQFERMTDSFEEMKRTLGFAIIQETGIGDLLKDGQRFNQEFSKQIDYLRPGLRFVGDAFRGITRFTGEIIKNGPAFGDALMQGLRAASPEATKFLNSIDDGIKKLSKFEIDPVASVKWAFNFGRMLGEVFDTLFSGFGTWIDSFYESKIKPILDSMNNAINTWEQARKNAVAVANAPKEFAKSVGDILEQSKARKMGPDAFAESLLANDRYKDAFRNQTGLVGNGFIPQSIPADKLETAKALVKASDEAKELLRQMGSAFAMKSKYNQGLSGDTSADPKLFAHFEKQETEARQKLLDKRKEIDKLMVGAGYKGFVGDDGSPLFDRTEPANITSAPLGIMKKLGIDEAMNRAEAKIISMVQGIQNANASTRIAEAAAGLPANGAGALFGGLGATSNARRFDDGLSMMVGGMAMATDAFKKTAFELPADTGQRFQDAADKIKLEHLDPARDFAMKQNDLIDMKKFDKLNNREFTLEYAKLLREFEGKLGPNKLPTAAEYGGEAVAAMYAKMAGDTGPTTVVNLLEQLVEQSKLQLEQEREFLNRANGGKEPVKIMPLPMR